MFRLPQLHAPNLREPSRDVPEPTSSEVTASVGREQHKELQVPDSIECIWGHGIDERVAASADCAEHDEQPELTVTNQ